MNPRRHTFAIWTISLAMLATIAPPAPAQVGSGNSGMATAATLDPSRIDELLAVATDLDDAYGAQLRELRTSDPASLRVRLAQSRRLLDLATLRRSDPDAYSLRILEVRTDAAVSRLASEIRAAIANGTARAALVPRLNQLRMQMAIQEAFSLQTREQYLCDIREQSEATRTELATPQAEADQRVEDAMESLIEGRSPATVLAVGKPGVLDLNQGGVAAQPTKLTPELIDSCLAVANDLTPTIGAKLESLRAGNAELFAKRLQSSETLIQLGRLRLREPHLYVKKRLEINADSSIRRLAREIRAAREQDLDTSGLEMELRNSLRIQTAFRLITQGAHLKSLDAELARLEAELEVSKNSVEARIEDRLKRLLRVPE